MNCVILHSKELCEIFKALQHVQWRRHVSQHLQANGDSLVFCLMQQLHDPRGIGARTAHVARVRELLRLRIFWTQVTFLDYHLGKNDHRYGLFENN